MAEFMMIRIRGERGIAFPTPDAQYSLKETGLYTGIN